MGKSLAVRMVLLISLICILGVRLNAADYFVNVYYNRYSPNYLTIAPGDSVFWINQDFSSHTVTSVNNLWGAGYLLDYQDTFGLTFYSVGTYSYYCEFDGFSGTVVVSSGPAAPPNDQCSSAVAMAEATLYTVNTAGATSTGDPVPSCAGVSKGVWYTFTPAANALVAVTTCGSDFDTVVSV